MTVTSLIRKAKITNFVWCFAKFEIDATNISGFVLFVLVSQLVTDLITTIPLKIWSNLQYDCTEAEIISPPLLDFFFYFAWNTDSWTEVGQFMNMYINPPKDKQTCSHRPNLWGEKNPLPRLEVTLKSSESQ